ncbi:hypothetical protein AB0L71_30625 [Streptomyces sp. NPDC052052]|uniref:hypothetical protein n=1 Tax=Streptomyces sp. NPDC052052 TaxID=3154756 RepID=UPI00341EC06E
MRPAATAGCDTRIRTRADRLHAGHDAYVAMDASGTLSRAKREAGLLRMQQAGIVDSDYATLMVESLADNAAPDSAALYAALDMPFAVLVGQISAAYRGQGVR